METHLIKALHAKPFISELNKRKVSYSRLAKQVGLPIEALSKTDAVVGEYALWQFVEGAAALLEDPLFGYACAASSPVLSLADLNDDASINLLSILRQFIQRAKQDSSSCHYSLIPTGLNQTCFHRLPAFGKRFSSWQVEQYMLTIFIQLIRLCAHESWLPKQVCVCSVNTPQVIPEAWSSIDITWGSSATQLSIENHLLAFAPKEANSSSPQAAVQFSLSIEQLIASHVRIQRANLNQLATELGMSTATLKRKLDRQGVNFTQLVEQEKFKWACELLSETSLSISQISSHLAYNHPSNFSRAFKHYSGEAPLRFRKQHSQ
ncbi:AraC family transcriptional regulator [Agarivorans sp. Alg241-V36]|uniref:helix-turn-helix domain-containing protein n=1 Tax=Agarivorans sp. Alg241-V36 TaxID=2305992 RepID=UPI0013D1F8F2|nr:AraC family transcriptional regulator [Agarivorans sp. Alg241-V36]